MSLSQWIHNDQGGIRTIISLYNTWEANRQAATQWRVVRYEDLLLHPERELGDLLAWMGFGRFDDEVLRQAVRLSSKEAMQAWAQREECLEGNGGSPKLCPYNGATKVRAGTYGQWKTSFSEEDKKWTSDLVANELSGRYGYTRDGEPRPLAASAIESAPSAFGR